MEHLKRPQDGNFDTKKMKTIKKHFETIQQAIDYRTKLYKKYDFVKITETPLFEESGKYVFVVNQLKKNNEIELSAY